MQDKPTNARKYYEALMQKCRELTGTFGYTIMWSHREEDIPARLAIFYIMQERGFSLDAIANATQSPRLYISELLNEYKNKDISEAMKIYRKLKRVKYVEK